MIIKDLYQIYKNCTGISIDTRTIQKGDLFFCLKGGNFDGNKFAHKSLELGAKAVIVDDAELTNIAGFIYVEDSLVCLQKLANYHRLQFDIPILGVTGSNGKTTTKELLVASLSTKYKVHATKGNFNNHIGVPLTLLAMPTDTEFAVIEMGANKIGDIAELCQIAAPNFGLITTIGKAHLEGFGSLEGVVIAKTEMYQYVSSNKGVVFVNYKNELLRSNSENLHQVVYYNNYENWGIDLLNASPFIVFKDKKDIVFETQLIGGYNFDNLLAAYAISHYFDVQDSKSLEALSDYTPGMNRVQVIRRGGNTVILDAYNANPSSMEAAIITFSNMESENKVFVLGDMFELGVYTKEEHKRIGELALNLIKGKVYLCGKYFYEEFPNKAFSDRETLIVDIGQKGYKESIFWIKGSRGMKLEEVVDVI